MRKTALFLFAATAVLMSAMSSCGGSGKKATEPEALAFDSVVVDTAAGLRGDGDSVKCTVRLNVLYAKGDDARLVNDSVRAAVLAFCHLETPVGKRLEGKTLPQAVSDYAAVYIENWRKEVGGIFEEGDYFFTYNYELLICTEVLKGRNGGLTYVIDGDEYTGGAHGMPFLNVMNFDLAEGKMLSKSDVFAEGSDDKIGREIKKSLLRQYGKKRFEELWSADGGNVESFSVPDNFILGTDSVAFIYQPYEIACYAEGRIRAAVAYSDLKGCMK